MADDLLSGQRITRRAEIAACNRVIAEVNRVMALQFQLSPDVLKEMQHCQTDAYRARHAASKRRERASTRNATA